MWSEVSCETVAKRKKCLKMCKMCEKKGVENRKKVNVVRSGALEILLFSESPPVKRKS